MKKRVMALCLLVVLVLSGCAAPHVDMLRSDTLGPQDVDEVIASPTSSTPPTAAPLPEGQASLPARSTPAAQTASPVVDVPTQTPGYDPLANPVNNQGDKICYLSFDDGPSERTLEVLDILKEKGAVATFFVLGEQAEKYPDIIRRMHAEGHKIGNHTYSHDTDKIYKTFDALLSEIKQTEAVIKGILGQDYDMRLFRFPSGSTNKKCRDYRDSIKAQGYTYYDWNVLNGDAEYNRPNTKEALMARFTQTLEDAAKKKTITVLMHDTKSKKATVEMLPDALDLLISRGYRFEILPIE